MKSILLVTLGACGAAGLAGCATSSGPTTAWGKAGVSMLDYRTDGGQCAVIAATAKPENNGSNTAGGINGKGGGAPETSPRDISSGGQPANTDAVASGGAFPTGGGGVYRDMAPPDMVSRAATQQQARDMAIQRARTQALKSCLNERGYTEFSLTPEQKQKLATLKPGSDERREFLYKLGTDESVLKSQAVPKGGS